MVNLLARVLGILLLFVPVPIAFAQQRQPDAPITAATAPAPETLLMLVRNALAALNQANFTGNYTVLHALGTPALQASNTPADLGIAFAPLRTQGADLSPALVLTPELTEPANIGPGGLLRVVGFVPTQPLRIAFGLNFRPVAGRWRLDSLTVSTVPVTPATTPPPATVPAPAIKADEKTKEKR